jgi:DNA-nicking Smr family endonuclease
MAKKPLNADDHDVWKNLIKSVTPLMRRKFFAKPPLAKPHLAKSPSESRSKNLNAKSVPLQPPTLPQKKSAIAPSPANLDGKGYGGISRASARLIKSGQMDYSDCLDLHGHGRNAAYLHLKSFIISAVEQGHRHVLVITGKGQSGKGVIKAHFPVWLNEPPLSAYIIAYCQAQRKDGGDGAWYVNLRRRR